MPTNVVPILPQLLIYLLSSDLINTLPLKLSEIGGHIYFFVCNITCLFVVLSQIFRVLHIIIIIRESSGILLVHLLHLLFFFGLLHMFTRLSQNIYATG
jgi:hypothetical protein